MHPSLQRDPAAPVRPRKGIDAEVLIDGFSPGPAKYVFDLDPRYSLLARYLLDNQRGFMRAMPLAQFPKPATIVLYSAPTDATQLRIAFGLTLLLDALEMNGRMGLRLNMGGRSVGKFIQPGEQDSCIRFLEVFEGVDDLTVKFRYRDRSSNSVVKGSVSL
jgi:hypothetical protein